VTGFAGLAGLKVTAGAARLTLDSRHVGEPPVAHGGVAMTLMEAACADLAGPDAACLSFKVQLVGPARQGDAVVATASVVRRTRTLVFLQARAETDAGPIALASAVYSA
jgi:uncharacterized protein (TIGR00369 family)